MSSREEEIRAGGRDQQASTKDKEALRTHSVSWDKYARDDTLSQQHLVCLKEFDKRERAFQSEMLNDPNKGPLVAEGLTLMLKTSTLLNNIKDLQYSLMLIEDIIEDRKTVSLFRDLNTVSPFQKLLDLLVHTEDAGIMRMATHSLAVLHYPGLGYGEPRVDKNLADLAEIARGNLDSASLTKGKAMVDRSIDMTSCLMVFLRETKCRKAVNDQFGLHRHLSAFLNSALSCGNVQLLYQVGFCLWLLSYDDEIAEKMDETDVVVNILKVMKTVSKEKVIRVCLACLRNLVDKGEHNQIMIDNEAIKQLAVLRNRKWSDDEVRDDLQFVSEALIKSVQVLSSLEMYQKEVSTGKLEWTPVHKSETFWRDNVTKMCPIGGSVESSGDLMALIQLLNTLHTKSSSGSLDTEETTTVAVICHDLGEFARFHPNGKKILQSDAASNPSNRSTKDFLMSIMSDPPGGSEEIAKQALTCIHKMMVNNWQFLESRSY